MFENVMQLLCPFIAFLVGPWAWIVGVFALAMAGLGIMSEEAKLAKTILPVMLGLGFLMAGPKFMDAAFGKNLNTMICSNVVSR